MELDHSNREKPDQVTWTTSDHDQEYSGNLRSYKCSFCQRGFSNAQALGGHMNIHRKDRARLKEFSRDKTTPFLDMNKKQSPPPLLHGEGDAGAQLQQQESSDERCKRPCTSSPIEIDSDTGDKLQLSLSIETSSSSNEKDESNSRVTRKHVKRTMQLNHGAPQTSEIDLELRLGPEPHQAATN